MSEPSRDGASREKSVGLGPLASAFVSRGVVAMNLCPFGV
jgi:hypothetical protein